MLNQEISREGLKAVRLARTERGTAGECAIRLSEVGMPISRTLWCLWEDRKRPIKIEQLLTIKDAFSLSWADITAVIVWWGSGRPTPERRHRTLKTAADALQDRDQSQDLDEDQDLEEALDESTDSSACADPTGSD